MGRRTQKVQSWWSGLSDQWKQLATIGAAVLLGAVLTRTADRLINVPDLVAQTATELRRVSEIVDHHEREIERRGPIITATYDLARSNAQAIESIAVQVGYLICLQEAEMIPERVRRCGIDSVRNNDGGGG